ncbi:hypothetical protein FXB40_21625 [Bradyrhizobium rifense]|uniref:Uncharacterized protein n=1 Tax=Bradyrhizobium rifense TaxID=515499 RepID=A0A5D3KI00_9BRAD|nr:hypothetical protein [Bradyrhizobium rifense]TYL93433.1 hypothetical protein FXB40_21625 [Bradyrhizobium rifense]
MSETFEPAPAFGFAPQSVSYYAPPDSATYLPEGPPADRYRALVQRAEDLHRLIPESDVRRQVGADRLTVEARLKRLTGHRSTGGFELPDDSPQVIPVRQELADLTAEQARLVALDATRSKAWHAAGTLRSNVKAWLADGRPRGTVMEAIKVPVPKLLKGETITAAIDRLGQQAKELRQRLVEIEHAPQPSAQARARLKEQFAALAHRGEISVDQLLQREGGKIDIPEAQVTLKVYNVAEPAAVAIGQIPDIVAMLVYANHDSLLALQDKKLAAAGAVSDARALTFEQRQKQTAQTMDALFAVELDQATLTLQAWESGLSIEPNADILPAAWLAVANVVAPLADTTTSPGQAYTVRR